MHPNEATKVANMYWPVVSVPTDSQVLAGLGGITEGAEVVVGTAVEVGMNDGVSVGGLVGAIVTEGADETTLGVTEGMAVVKPVVVHVTP